MSISRGDPEPFERIADGVGGWPEGGSRITVRLVNGARLAGGWVEVEESRFRYAVDWSSGFTVNSLTWEYLATETHWTP